MADGTGFEDLRYASIPTVRERYADRTLSPKEYVTAVLDAIERTDPALGAFLTLAGERALEEASAAEELLVREGPGVFRERPLLGMPVSVKDLTPTQGIRTTRGSLLHRDHVPHEDAPAVARLRAAGAVVIGKTNTPDGGWSGSGVNRLGPPTRNPWNPALTAGGSSAGAAAAVATGLGVAATGTDGAGSVRIPAAFCGVVGFKPTRGLVPYLPVSSEGLSHLGPLTRTVGDAGLLLRVMSGHDPRDPWSVTAVPPGPPVPARLRIGWIRSLGRPDPHPEVEALAREAVGELAAQGHLVEELDPPFEDPYPLLEVLLASGEAAAHAEDPPGTEDLLDPGLREVVEFGRSLRAVELAAAYAGRDRLWARAHRLMRDYDLLALPTVPVLPFAAELSAPEPAVPKGRLPWLAWTPGTYPFNLTGQPAVSVPAGRTSAGLPVGLQLVGARHRDPLVLATARRLERARPWRHWYAETARPDQFSEPEEDT
ncbi:amidase [Streptomyces eurythermus]|uniref:amidase n=1 Tax=Streptomyces eurythermus TaxID=42237 RepID=UPI003402ACA3